MSLKKPLPFSRVALISLLFASFFLATNTHAQGIDIGLDFASGIGLPGESIQELITNFLRALLGFVGFILFLQILHGGYLYMIHGGKEEAREVAVNTIRNSIIGFFIVMSANSIAQFVVSAVVNASQDNFY